MPKYKQVNNELIEITGSELAELEAREQAFNDGALNRELEALRFKRNNLLAETDWRANSDVAMSDAWKTYRQSLRDLPGTLNDVTVQKTITWPDEPS